MFGGFAISQSGNRICNLPIPGYVDRAVFEGKRESVSGSLPPPIAAHHQFGHADDRQRWSLSLEGKEVRRPFGTTRAFRQYGRGGAWVSDLLPHIAKYELQLAPPSAPHSSAVQQFLGSRYGIDSLERASYLRAGFNPGPALQSGEGREG
jgi:hypothetical protein